jgi:hypothetical protein
VTFSLPSDDCRYGVFIPLANGKIEAPAADWMSDEMIGLHPARLWDNTFVPPKGGM